MRSKKKQWTRRGRYLLAPTGTPGIWEIQEGGYLARTTIVDPVTKTQVDRKRVFRDAPLSEVVAWLEAEENRIRTASASAAPQEQRFSEFAASLLEEKIEKREIRSAKGREKWGHTLNHLIVGTEGPKSKQKVGGFGDMFVHMINRTHVEKWQLGIAGLVNSGDYSPTTANTWLSVLRVVMKAGKRKFQLPACATDDIDDFDTSEWEIYSFEEPNSLTPDEVPAFLARMKDLYPQHYAMTYLGFITGLRPSSLRPLRRRGENTDVLWDEGRIYVRRSHTLGQEVMNTTKQKRRYPIDLPPKAIEVLKWHVESQIVGPAMEESDLLFPSVHGTFRCPSVLNKPFADVATALGLKKHLSQRCMRRTYNDLMRAAGINLAVLKSVSGHLTDDMVEHYSTISGEEQRASIGKVIDLMEAKAARQGKPPTEATREAAQ